MEVDSECRPFPLPLLSSPWRNRPCIFRSAGLAIFAGRRERKRRQASSTHCGDDGRVPPTGWLRVGVEYICRVWVGGEARGCSYNSGANKPFRLALPGGGQMAFVPVCSGRGRNIRHCCCCLGLGSVRLLLFVCLNIWMAGCMFMFVGEGDGMKGVLPMHDVMRLQTGREGGAEARAITGRSA